MRSILQERRDYSVSSKQPFVPPDRGWQAVLNAGKRLVAWIDDDVALHARHIGRHNQDRCVTGPGPRGAVLACRRLVSARPIRERVLRDPGKAQAPGQFDLDEVLVGRHQPAEMGELFQHRGRIVLAGVDDRSLSIVPASGADRRAGRVEDRVVTVGVADPIGA